MGCKCNSRSIEPCNYCAGDEPCECGSGIIQSECGECCWDCSRSVELCDCNEDE